MRVLGFKGNYLIDTGAGSSDTTSGNITGKGTDGNLPAQGIAKSDTGHKFADNWAHAVAQMIPADDQNTQIIASFPGPSKINSRGEQEVTLTNIKDSQQTSLRVTSPMLKRALGEEGVEVRTLLILNDGHLHNVNVLRKNIATIQNGKQFVGALNIFPGGGCGGATFRKEDRGIVSNAEERGHEIYPKHLIKPELLTAELLDRAHRLSIEEYSTSASAAIRNFAKELGFDDDAAKALADTKEGRIVTQWKIELDRKDPEQEAQYDALVATGLFNIYEGGKQLMLKNPRTMESSINDGNHDKAKKVAVREFFKGIGIALSRYATQNAGTDVYVPTGLASHFAKALDGGVERAAEIVRDTTWNNLDNSVRANVVGEKENLGVYIEDIGDPTSLENINALLESTSPNIDGFRVRKVPFNAIA